MATGMDAMARVFRALSDPSRRRLLDRLYRRDGQTLGELERSLPRLSRFGVMKHLRVLERAHLVTTHRAGREKFHYLNPVPIRLIHDRWISKYAEPWTRAMGELKAGLEGRTMKGPRHVYQVYIRTTPEALWAAITNPEHTRRFFYETDVEWDGKAGSPIVHRMKNGAPALEGKVLEAVPGKRLVHTFSMAHNPEAAKDRSSRVTWEIEPQGPLCLLTVTHDDFDGETRTYQEVSRGWNPVLSGLKTLLETGRPLFAAA